MISLEDAVPCSKWCEKMVKNRDEFENVCIQMYDSWTKKGWVPEYDATNSSSGYYCLRQLK